MKDKKWGAVKRSSCRRYDDMMMGSVVGLPLAKKSAAHRCALQRVSERCATLLTMDTAKLWKPLTRVCDGMLLGAPASISRAAARVSSGLAGGVNTAMTKSKLCKIEADTVECMSLNCVGHIPSFLSICRYVRQKTSIFILFLSKCA
jgi:hypothetical protein